MLMKKLAAAATIALMSVAATGASAVTVTNTKSNVIFIVDESGSMGGDQAFLANTVIDALDTGLAGAGVTDTRLYGVVGFGSANPLPRTLGGGLLNAADTKTQLSSLLTNGSFEDGYQAIKYALTAFNFTAGAAVNFILVTDEDRVLSGSGNNAGDTSLSSTSITNDLKSRNILLNAIVEHTFNSDDGSAIGIDSKGNGYRADGSGGYTTSTGGVAVSGNGDAYIPVALASGGAAWSLTFSRSGGNNAKSFVSAFVDIKVGEIISQPPTNPVPLPAAGWLLIAGIGGLGALSRRKKAAA